MFFLCFVKNWEGGYRSGLLVRERLNFNNYYKVKGYIYVLIYCKVKCYIYYKEGVIKYYFFKGMNLMVGKNKEFL